jgi:hypothetical protein
VPKKYISLKAIAGAGCRQKKVPVKKPGQYRLLFQAS